MNRSRLLPVAAASVALIAFAAACGGTSSPSAPPPSSSVSTGPTAGTGQGSGALTAEAQATAAGDIPDNQVFLTFTNRPAGYSMKYPEGWAQVGGGARVTFRDKNNVVRIVVEKAMPVSVASVMADMQRLEAATPSLRFGAPTTLALNGRQAVKVVYSTDSAPNAVTGKRVKLVVDRYYVPAAGKTAIVDLGTPQGVDNVDAYRLMIESFRWA